MSEATPQKGRGRDRWPLLEEQLAEAQVIHGSALEDLIRANQDFRMLRPAEATDEIRLPMWLRVYWRKLHPDAIYEGPSGGYPLVLRELYHWMLAHQDLEPADGPKVESPDPRKKFKRPRRPSEGGGRRG